MRPATDGEHGHHTFDFRKAFPSEIEYLRERRRSAGAGPGPEEPTLAEDPSPTHGNGSLPPRVVHTSIRKLNLFGLALSGGGIRSATFNLGLLQGLARHKMLPVVDYLSTVSGGGYIGGCLTSLLDGPKTSLKWEEFPFRYVRKESADERAEVKHLRRHGEYLALEKSLLSPQVWRIGATYLSGLLLTWLFPAAVLILLIWYLRMQAGLDRMACWNLVLVWGETVALGLVLWIGSRLFGKGKWRRRGPRIAGGMAVGAVALALFPLGRLYGDAETARRLLLVISGGLATLVVLVRLWASVWYLRDIKTRSRTDNVQGFLLLGAALLLAAVGVDWLVCNPDSVPDYLRKAEYVAPVYLLVLLTGLFELGGRRLKQLHMILFRTALFTVMPVLMVFGLTRLSRLDFWSWKLGDFPGALAGGLVLLILAILINQNRITLHHFYRDRLSEAFIIKRAPAGRVDGSEAAGSAEGPLISNEPLRLKDLHRRGNGAPYHLINATVNLPSSHNEHLKGRGADLFEFSRYNVGSASTGWCCTGAYERGVTRLASAVAVSGAAVSPVMGLKRNSFIGFLFSMLNIRLEQWMPNPIHGSWHQVASGLFWPWCFVKGLICRGTEKDVLLSISDGGHFDNLGLYPLLVRGCRVILVSDATGDPGAGFGDLASIIRLARIDLGVGIDINVDPLRPGAGKRSRWAVGPISYPNGESGILIYVNTLLVGGEPEDLQAYGRTHPGFPDQSTGDQFFDEAQFESYRKLGEISAHDLLGGFEEEQQAPNKEKTEDDQLASMRGDLITHFEKHLKPAAEGG